MVPVASPPEAAAGKRTGDGNETRGGALPSNSRAARLRADAARLGERHGIVQSARDPFPTPGPSTKAAREAAHCRSATNQNWPHGPPVPRFGNAPGRASTVCCPRARRRSPARACRAQGRGPPGVLKHKRQRAQKARTRRKCHAGHSEVTQAQEEIREPRPRSSSDGERSRNSNVDRDGQAGPRASSRARITARSAKQKVASWRYAPSSTPTGACATGSAARVERDAQEVRLPAERRADWLSSSGHHGLLLGCHVQIPPRPSSKSAAPVCLRVCPMCQRILFVPAGRTHIGTPSACVERPSFATAYRSCSRETSSGERLRSLPGRSPCIWPSARSAHGSPPCESSLFDCGVLSVMSLDGA